MCTSLTELAIEESVEDISGIRRNSLPLALYALKLRFELC